MSKINLKNRSIINPKNDIIKDKANLLKILNHLSIILEYNSYLKTNCNIYI